MHKLLIFFLTVALGLLPLSASGETHTRAEVRQLYAQLVARGGASPYLEKPDIDPPYGAGSLTDEALQAALNCVNFLRRVAYVENDVRLSDLYTLRAQYAAALLAINDELSHDAAIAPGMSLDFYETAHAGTASSNIASINWMTNDILVKAVEYFVRDDGTDNLAVLGHRRWLLNPNMGETGFGLANAASGITYAAMYAHDLTGHPADWDYVAWPSRGAFPAELMADGIAWSVTLNPLVYDAEKSDLRVTMSEKTAGQANFTYFTLSLENYGAGPCVIFVPDLAAMGVEQYQQNQVWQVEISGLKTVGGEDAAISYEVDMIALTPMDPSNVEMDREEVTLAPGEAARLSASVVPAWADDLTVSWTSSDEAVATVDESGNVTAVAEGACKITAASVNGKTASCAVSVAGKQ